jgi:histone H3/H4
VKKICKVDPDVKNISKEALLLITKATECFLQHITSKSCAYATRRGAKAVKDVDFRICVHKESELEFLRRDLPMDPLSIKAAEAALAININRRSKPKVSSGKTEAITSFFTAKRKAETVDVDDGGLRGTEVGQNELSADDMDFIAEEEELDIDDLLDGENIDLEQDTEMLNLAEEDDDLYTRTAETISGDDNGNDEQAEQSELL